MTLIDRQKGPGEPPSDDPDIEMVRAVLDGDPEAYRVLVERYERRIYHVVYGMVRSQEDARDLAQDCFVKAFQNLHRFRLESKFYTWLCRIAMNLSIDHLRKMKHRSHAAFDDERGASEGAQVVRLSSRRDNPSENVARQQMSCHHHQKNTTHTIRISSISPAVWLSHMKKRNRNRSSSWRKNR